MRSQGSTPIEEPGSTRRRVGNVLPMLGAQDADSKVEELRGMVMDQFHEVHNALMDNGVRIDALSRKTAHLEREMEMHTERLNNCELEVADAIVQIHETFVKADVGMREFAADLTRLDKGCEQFYNEYTAHVQKLTVELQRLSATDEDLYALLVKQSQEEAEHKRKLDSLVHDVKLLDAKAKLETDDEGKLDGAAAKAVYLEMDKRVEQLEAETKGLSKKVFKNTLRSRWPTPDPRRRAKGQRHTYRSRQCHQVKSAPPGHSCRTGTECAAEAAAASGR